MPVPKGIDPGKTISRKRKHRENMRRHPELPR